MVPNRIPSSAFLGPPADSALSLRTTPALAYEGTTFAHPLAMRTAFFFAFSFHVLACGGAATDPSTTDHSAPGSPTAPSSPSPSSPTTPTSPQPGGSIVIPDDATLALRTKGG